MIRHLTTWLLLGLLAVVSPKSAIAQETPFEGVAAAEEESWERIAQRAEDLARRDDGSVFAVSRLRAELVVWRDFFLDQTTVNTARIATVNSQLAALGAVPEIGEEPASVAARRAELIAQRQDLMAPRLLAQEAYARANGIIGEFDVQILQQQTAELTVRGPSPLDPTHLFSAFGALWNLAQIISVETAAGLSSQRQSGALDRILPRALVLLVVGVALLGMGRRTVTRWRTALAKREGPWLPLKLILLSLVQILVPLIGLLVLTEGLQTLEIFGLRGSDVVEAIPLAGFLVIFCWWLTRHIFPIGDSAGFLGYSAETRATGRRYALAIAWALALGALFDAGLQTLEVSEGTAAAIEWPVLALLGLLFWRCVTAGADTETHPD